MAKQRKAGGENEWERVKVGKLSLSLLLPTIPNSHHHSQLNQPTNLRFFYFTYASLSHPWQTEWWWQGDQVQENERDDEAKQKSNYENLSPLYQTGRNYICLKPSFKKTFYKQLRSQSISAYESQGHNHNCILFNQQHRDWFIIYTST